MWRRGELGSRASIIVVGSIWSFVITTVELDAIMNGKDGYL